MGLQVPCGVDTEVQEEDTIPKMKKELVPVIRELAQQKESSIVEGRLVGDHVHMLITIPPKYAVAQVIGYIKGKSAIWIARMCGQKELYRPEFLGQRILRLYDRA